MFDSASAVTPTRTSAANRRAFGIGFAALSAIAVLPIAAVRLPAILDYPNHMARMHILAALPDNAELARYYSRAWAPIPDLALDIAAPWLTALIPVDGAMRLFLALVLLALASGCAALHRAAYRNQSLWPLFAFLLLYNRMLLWGFINYLAGVALALWALAAWIAIERRPPALRIGIAAVLGVAVYFAHLAAFGCYALAILAYSASPAAGVSFRIRQSLSALLPALISLSPAAALFLLSPTSGASVGLGYGNLLRKFDLPVSIFDNYDRALDGATFGVLLLAVIAGLARGGVLIHPRLRWSVIALVAAFFALPSRMLTASGLDHRLPVAIAFVFVGASDWGAIAAPRRRLIAGGLLALFAVRLAIVGAVWLDADREYAALWPALATVPRGGAVAIAAPAGGVQAGGVPLYHFPTLAVVFRDAFAPTIFADPSQQPIVLTERGRQLASEANEAALWKDAARGSLPTLPGYDRLMIVDPPPLDRTRLPGPVVFDAPRLIVVDISAAEKPGR